MFTHKFIIAILCVAILATTIVAYAATDPMGIVRLNATEVRGRDDSGNATKLRTDKVAGRDYIAYDAKRDHKGITYVKLYINGKYAWFYSRDGFMTKSTMKSHCKTWECPFQCKIVKDTTAKVCYEANGKTTWKKWGKLAKGSEVLVLNLKQVGKYNVAECVKLGDSEIIYVVQDALEYIP